jgi:chemotaxis protein MotB
MRVFAWFALALAGCPGRTDGPSANTLQTNLEREVIALNSTVQRLQTDCGNPDRPDPLYQDLRSVFPGPDVTVSRDGRDTRVSLPVAVLFSDSFSVQFRSEAAGQLDLLATALNLHPDVGIRIEGHASDRAIPTALARKWPDALALSLARASALQVKMSRDFGVATERFVVSGRGDWAPIASNDIPSGQAQNDRVDVVLTPSRSVVPATP